MITSPTGNLVAEAIRPAIQMAVFEFNDIRTRDIVYDVAKYRVEELKQYGHIAEYRIVCDESNNPDEIINKNETHLDVYYREKKDGPFMMIHFEAKPTSIEFEEVVESVRTN